MTRLFGFGSLVNTSTLGVPHLSVKRGHITGFRRDWCMPFSQNGMSFVALGLVEDRSSRARISGLTLSFSKVDTARIYDREKYYTRVLVNPFDCLGNLDVAISFAAKPVQKAQIPLSYLATVVEGFLNYYGEQGVLDFFDTTEFAGHEIFDDRLCPIYRRASVSRSEIYEMALDLAPGTASATCKVF